MTTKKKPEYTTEPTHHRRADPARRCCSSSIDLTACAQRAHAEIALRWKTVDAPLEDLQGALLAAKYTERWAPENGTQLLILAESHAKTPSDLLSIVLDRDDHFGHLNLVHCPSYGESSLLETAVENILSEKRITKSEWTGCSKGTLQFWRVLAALAGLLDHVQLLGKPVESAKELANLFCSEEGGDVQARLQSKFDIFRTLQKRGIMLADTSPVPIYAGGGIVKRTNKITQHVYVTRDNKLPDPIKKSVLSAAFEHYSSKIIEKYRPKHVLVFGVSVETAIGKSHLEQVVQDNGGSYLGAIHHPSYNRVQGRRFIPHLCMLRFLGASVNDGTPESLRSGIQWYLAMKLHIPGLEDKKKKKRIPPPVQLVESDTPVVKRQKPSAPSSSFNKENSLVPQPTEGGAVKKKVTLAWTLCCLHQEKKLRVLPYGLRGDTSSSLTASNREGVHTSRAV